jgi:hypothetical protein
MGAHSRDRRPITAELTTPGGLARAVVLLVLLLALLALLVFSIYVVIERPRGLSTATAVLECMACAMTGGNLAWNLLHARRRSAPDIAERIGEALPFLVFAIALVSTIGAFYGWTAGGFRYLVLGGDSALMLAMLVCWLGGKRWLATALAARVAAREARPF